MSTALSLCFRQHLTGTRTCSRHLGLWPGRWSRTRRSEQWIAPSRQGFTDARRGLALAAIPLGGAAAAGDNTYGGVGGPAPRNTPRTFLLDQIAAALRRTLLAAGLLRFLARTQLGTPILSRLLARLLRDQALADDGVFGRVDYVLVPGRQYAAASALADDSAANAAPQNNCHGDARQVDDLGFGGLFGHVARRHMRDLVGHRRRQLVLAFQGFPFALKIF